MHKGLLITIIGGGLIVLLTAIFAFTPNSANPSSIPALKSYALALIKQFLPLPRQSLPLPPLGSLQAAVESYSHRQPSALFDQPVPHGATSDRAHVPLPIRRSRLLILPLPLALHLI